jgi:subtilisin-like proprotein convertase family protein
VRPFSEGKRERRQGGSIVLKMDDTMKTDAVTGKVKGGNWRLEIEDEQRKLGRYVKSTIEPNC